jgi:hypothetical protein
MNVFDLGDGKQVVIRNERLQIWANKGSIGVEMTPEQMEAIGITLWVMARRIKRAR